MTIQPGDVIGERYRLVKRVGSGGMGEVWQALDGTLQRPVALKILTERSIDETGTRAFLHEARLAAAVRHRNVVDMLDFGKHSNGAPYIVMELLEGETLGDVFFREGRLSFEQIVRIIIGTLSGLAAAHDAGIIHRDLKPENIFLARDRDSLSAKLVDFGISKSLNATRPSPVVTQEGRVVGTPAYMSPEQARGLRDVDHRTDLYSVGVILFEALSGEPPFFDENPGDLMVQIITSPTPRLDTKVPALGKPLADFVQRAMQRLPEMRFQSADEMRQELEHLAAHDVSEQEARTLSQRPLPPSWRQTQAAARAAMLPDTQDEAAVPTDRPLATRATATAPGKGSRGPVMATGAMLALAFAGGLLWLRFGPQPEAAKPYVIKVQPAAAEPSNEADDDANDAAPDTPSPEAEAPDQGPSIAPSPRHSDRRPRVKPSTPKRAQPGPAATESPDTLSSRFQRQQQGVARCLQAAPAGLSQDGMAIRFEVDTSGHVIDANVLPAELASTATGRCMRKAAATMRFGRQTSQLTFRIPLRAKAK